MKKLLFVLRIAAALAAAVMLGWFIAPIVRYNMKNIGNIAGIALCLWTLLLCCAPVQRRLSAVLRRHAVTRWLWRLVNACYAAVLVYGAAVTGIMLFSMTTQPQPDATAVVLGAGVNAQGKPTMILEKRIQAAEKYLSAHPSAKAVLTGGKGFDEPVSEAQCMYSELTARGIAPERLLREDKSTDTVENFRYSMQIINENKLNQNLAVITDGFHQCRARLIAQKQGAGITYGAVNAETDLIFVPTYTVREWFAFPTLLFK